MKNLFGKSRTVDNPYATYKLGDVEWRALKTDRRNNEEDTNQYGRWISTRKEHYTKHSREYGDEYIKTMMRMMRERVQDTTRWNEA